MRGKGGLTVSRLFWRIGRLNEGGQGVGTPAAGVVPRCRSQRPARGGRGVSRLLPVEIVDGSNSRPYQVEGEGNDVSGYAELLGISTGDKGCSDPDESVLSHNEW